MEDAMLQRLKATVLRLAEIDNELMDEHVTRDIYRFRDISKERAAIAPSVDKFNEYLKIIADKKEALDMSNDSDPEMAAMGRRVQSFTCSRKRNC